jgi:hypothetical protein
MSIDNIRINSLFILLKAQAWESVVKEIRNDSFHAHGVIKMVGFYDNKIATTVNALHVACKYNAPVEVIEALIEANEKAVSQMDSSYQRLPLHVAVMNQCSSRVVGTLLAAGRHQKTAKVQDASGRLPIHYACKNRVTGEGSLRRLLKAYPESALVSDDQGFLPLHVACRTGMPMVMIRMLLLVAPESILAKTNNGATPVHCAKNAAKGKGEARSVVAETLQRVAEETKKMEQQQKLEGPLISSCFDSASVSTGSSYSTLRTSHRLLHSIGSSSRPTHHEEGVPSRIRCSDDSMSSSERSDSISPYY